MKKTILAVITAILLATSANAAFTKTNTYQDGTFSDVPASKWYSSEVGGAYELGLMNGVGGGLFNPDGSFTVAEAITLASRARAVYNRETIEPSGEPWYAPYVDYAKKNGIISSDYTAQELDRPAKRFEVTEMIRKALSDGYFEAVNSVSSIPDVSDDAPYRAGTLLLYKAGIVMGSDSIGTFNPDADITRAEASAIINRVAMPEKRLKKTLEKVSYSDAYLLAQATSMSGDKQGISSGWLLDNRGGVPRTTLLEGYGALNDIDDQAAAAYVREFNKITTGKITLETNVQAKGDGSGIEFRNDKGKTVYRAEINDGAWRVLDANGNYTKLCELSDSFEYEIYVALDLDNLCAKTVMNGTDCGTYPLCVGESEANVLNFRFSTSDAGKGMVNPIKTLMYVNYAVYDDFRCGANDTIPYGWTSSAKVSSYALKLEKGTAAKSFAAVSGNAVAEFHVLTPKNENVSYTLGHDDKSVIKLETNDGKFLVNGKEIYTAAAPNLWYRFRFELDTKNKICTVKINGREVAKVDFASSASSISGLVIENNSDTAVYFDNFRVFRNIEHEDYVPAPVKPTGDDDYTVGVNVCPLWQNGKHFGWSCITPYDDIKPVLGYYDEGNPETADWEIKYLLEHGVDFQAFCVFFTKKNGSVCLDNDGYPHLYEGYMNAKYSDMSKFCAIIEAANAYSATSLDEWKTQFVPYIIENLIKDPRYLVVDNKPVIMVFGASSIKSRAGSTENARAMFDYLEEELVKLGYDGAVYLGAVVSGSGTDEFAELGYDGSFAYNWGTTGNRLTVNKDYNTSYAQKSGVYHVPTVSVGFNNIGWGGTRNPIMTVADYKAANAWVRDEYLTKYPTEEWQKNLVMLSTWNEYGEGTYIMPTDNEQGFGYLDALREVYTKEPSSESVDTVPTAAQKDRITHLYPQYRRLLRRNGEGDATASLSEEEYNTAFKFDFSQLTEDQYGYANVKVEYQDQNGLAVTAENRDPIIGPKIGYLGNIDLSKIVAIKITANIPAGDIFQVYFATSEETGLSEEKSFSVKMNSGSVETVVIDTMKNSKWTGTLTELRLDPGSTQGSTIKICSVELLSLKDTSKPVIRDGTKKIYINGVETDMNLTSEFTSDGELLVPFDPEIGMDFRLNVFHEWFKETGVLKLNFKKHTVIFTVGKDTYTVNGQEQKLPYVIKTSDGLPMIPMKRLCEAVGYEYSENEAGDAVIVTPEKKYYDDLEASRVPGQWEFNTSGDTEGWSSGFMNLMVDDGYMSCDSLTQSGDPTIPYTKDISLLAKKYSAFEIRVRYKYTNPETRWFTMYFTTDKSKGLNEDKTIKSMLKSHDSEGEWEIYTVDLKNNEFWKDTITGFRFDPFDAYGHMDIDYIRFIVDPDYDEEAEAKLAAEEEETKLAEEEAERKLGTHIKNGDAEGDVVGFTSETGDVSIVTDPNDEKNHCYLFKPNHDHTVWLYANHKQTYTPGKTYKVSLDVMLAAHGTSTDIPDDFTAQVIPNIRYKDNNNDHPLGDNRISVSAGKWTYYEFSFTIPESSTDRSNDELCFYTDPKDGKGVGFYLDNVVITEE